MARNDPAKRRWEWHNFIFGNKNDMDLSVIDVLSNGI